MAPAQPAKKIDSIVIEGLKPLRFRDWFLETGSSRLVCSGSDLVLTDLASMGASVAFLAFRIGLRFGIHADLMVF
jgi:hypothetical protein